MLKKLIAKIPKRVIIVCILFIVFIVIAILFKMNNKMVCSFNKDILVLNTEVAGKSKQQINELLATRWLAQYKSFSVCPEYRLSDYRVESVTGENTPDMFELTYSVLPAFPLGSIWIAGNGVQEGAFIAYKFGFVKIKKTDKGLGIDSISTGL